MRGLAIAAGMVVCLLSGPVRGQVGSAGLISPEIARQFGLERMWFTQLSVDRNRGRLAGLHLHVSNTEAHTVFQFVYDGQRYVFSQHDRDAFGEELGVEGAKKQAEQRLEELRIQLEAAGKTEVKLPAVETHVIPKMTLYATSQRGAVHALDAETGRTRWSVAVGNPELTTTAPFANDRFVGLCNGSTLYILSAADGSTVWSRMVIGAPGAGPALSEELVFVPMIGGQVESYWLDNPRRPAGVHKSFGRVMVQPVLSHNSVAWATDLGNLYVGMAHEQGMRFRLEAKDAIEVPPAFMPPDKLFAASRDGYVYCVDERRGSVLWRFVTGEPISHATVALGNHVYAITQRGTMFAIDVETASEVWTASGIRSYVAGNDGRLYCMDTRGNLVILDVATGSRLGAVPALQVDMPLLNTQTDRIILATSTGLVQCFREANRPYPATYYRMEVESKPARPARPQPSRPSESAEPAPGAALPATDPFATPGSAPAPSAAPPAAGADPFGRP